MPYNSVDLEEPEVVEAQNGVTSQGTMPCLMNGDDQVDHVQDEAQRRGIGKGSMPCLLNSVDQVVHE